MSGGGYGGKGSFFTGLLFFFGALLDLQGGELSSGVGRISSGGTGLLGVLGTGARISI
jgi:hypothetical protein